MGGAATPPASAQTASLFPQAATGPGGAKLTPMVEQYLRMKMQHPDAILFFRLGDFYEMFFDDAIKASGVLGVTLTSRNKEDENPVPMCGVPYHAAESYIAKLVGEGYHVAVCDQVSDPAMAKGLVERAITRVVTPSIALEPALLSDDKRRMLASASPILPDIDGGEPRWAICMLDFGTGAVEVFQTGPGEPLAPILGGDEILEVLLDGAASEDILQSVRKINRAAVIHRLAMPGLGDAARDRVAKQLGQADAGALTLPPAAWAALGRTLDFVTEMHKRPPAHLRLVRTQDQSESFRLDPWTVENLELFAAGIERRSAGSLYRLLNGCATPMGARLLRQHLIQPLGSVEAIERRLDAVTFWVEHRAEAEDIRARLSTIGDVERSAVRIIEDRASPRDYGALRQFLRMLPQLRHGIERLKHMPLATGGEMALVAMDDCLASLAQLLESALNETLPALFGQGAFFGDGYDQQLDDDARLRGGAEAQIEQIQLRERASTGISTLKVGYTRAFGYYIDVTRRNESSVPAHYQQRQTLVNSIRYITDELKELEQNVLSAEDRYRLRERELLVGLWQTIRQSQEAISRQIDWAAQLDVSVNHALKAIKNRWGRPELTNTPGVDIEAGRHPVVEEMVRENFNPNDAVLNREKSLIVLTGPNMAGKSTYMRQTALIVLLAQIGSYVPATRARLCPVDQIYTRVGAADDLTRGRSTFMVEMEQTAHILAHATNRSLVLLDEIGRGTSTFDGLSIAWAVALDLARRIGALTIFATHYHELAEIDALAPTVVNRSVGVKQWQGQLIFVHQVNDGPTSHSYGIEVAAMAGLPHHVLIEARRKMMQLEQAIPALVTNGTGEADRQGLLGMPVDTVGTELRARLAAVDPDRLTPLQAIQLLAELSQYAKQK